MSLRLCLQETDPETPDPVDADDSSVVVHSASSTNGSSRHRREVLQFEVSADKFRALHGELLEARRLMKLLEQRE